MQQSFFPRRVLHTTAVQLKTAKFKPKIARSKPIKTPSALALDNFDFYYGPLFGNQWPSIRLGLLSSNKFVAVLNNFSNEREVNEKILRDLGTIDVMDYLIGTKTTDDPLLEKKKLQVNQKLFVDKDGVQLTESEAFGQLNQQLDAEHGQNKEDLELRLEGGIHEFTQPSDVYTMGELQKNEEVQPRARNIEITGLERFSGNLLKKEDFLMYPRKLKLFTFPSRSILDFPGPVKDKNDISSWWLLDGGSVIPVLALDLNAEDNVLDMCAAPGGKSLLIAQTGLFKKLTCNDAKLSRIGQLRRGLSMYIPSESPEAQKIVVKKRDASNFEGWVEESIYDKVLLDAPCTTDRLAVNQDEGNLFGPSMTQTRLNLPQLQVKLLINALRAVKVGGSVVYSTCSLSPMQNDAVVENATVVAEQQFGIKSVEKSLVQLQRHLQPSGLYRFAANCQRGMLIVPYVLSNFGPMYVCKLQRVS